MPAPKGTQFQAPDGADQQRHLFNSTQDHKTADRQQAAANRTAKKAKRSDESPIQSLAKEMDSTGNPVPDVASTGPTGDGADDIDPFDAMHADFD
ncbi:hypothetical protein N7468_001607 [Penicillium chermesinum]|uniref:Uncharacterized protein n=1 Tax=Penicillium chermesinum TaxID=63820 RepID=A0A9W9TYT6_9EURO|nr:uncharacterized protein N7468_001607 [Penicillium chermesinum]KAJ5246624.1 hypothetical protein N7468_001607 [Penicillium chermesinum]KAJ6144895.1 hypothetical protein N7470_008790 [Penicillium chermesinum]